MLAMAGLISNHFGMTALYGLLRILLCFEFVPPPNLLFFTFVFVLPRPPPFFAGSELPSSIIFGGGSENFCRTFGPADWHFLSDILKNVRLSDKSDEFRQHCTQPFSLHV